MPAQMMAQAGATKGAEPPAGTSPPWLRVEGAARRHRGRPQDRALRCVVATSTLELGIDMGAVDLVIQVESPPSVASGLQRIGRAGHQVGEVSRGVLFPKHRADLIHRRSRPSGCSAGQIEALSIPAKPLDVLAQQTRGGGRASTPSTSRVVRHRASQRTLRRPAPQRLRRRRSTCSPGLYPCDEFAELRPRLVWDRVARRAHRAAPARGSGWPSPPAARSPTAACSACSSLGESEGAPGRRARRGDGLRVARGRRVRARHHELAHRRDHARPCRWSPRVRAARQGAVLAGRRARPPGRARAGARLASCASSCVEAAAREWRSARPPRADGPRRARGQQPDRVRRRAEGIHRPGADRPTTLVVERFRDELGDWRLVLHSPYGMPRARAVGTRGQRPAPGAATASTARRWPATTASSCASPRRMPNRPGRPVRLRAGGARGDGDG